MKKKKGIVRIPEVEWRRHTEAICYEGLLSIGQTKPAYEKD